MKPNATAVHQMLREEETCADEVVSLIDEEAQNSTAA
jgi:hypothetical protein